MCASPGFYDEAGVNFMVSQRLVFVQEAGIFTVAAELIS